MVDLNRLVMIRRLSILLPFVLGYQTAAEHPGSKALLRMVPDDVIAALLVDPTQPPNVTDGWSAFDLARPLAEQAQQLGLLSVAGSDVRIWIDIFAGLSLLLDYPHTIALIDIHVTERGAGSHRFKDLRAAIVIECGSDTNRLEQRIQHLLATYTNKEFSTLESRPTSTGAKFELRDRRLPDWLSFSWGRINDFYVVAIGKGAFERIAQASEGSIASLAADPWMQTSLDSPLDVPVTFTAYARIDKLRDSLGHSVGPNIDRVLQAVSLPNVQRTTIFMGTKGRSLELAGVAQRSNRTLRKYLVGHRFHSARTRAAIPKQASRYAIVDGDLGAIMRGLTEAVWSARSPRARENQERFWSSIDQSSGVNLNRDVYGKLGGPIILHNYPPHPLGLPFAWNILVPIRENPGNFQDSLDQWFGELQQIVAQGGASPLIRSAKTEWSTKFGVLGPAAAVSDSWLVLGFSPIMVRQVAGQLASGTPTKE